MSQKSKEFKNKFENLAKIAEAGVGQETMVLEKPVEVVKTEEEIQGQKILPTLEKKVIENASDASLSNMMGDAPACPTCGHITVRNGSCYKCLNCGDSLGCS